MRFNPEMHDKEVVRELRRFFEGRRKNDGGKKSSDMKNYHPFSIADVYRDYLRQRESFGCLREALLRIK